MIQTAHMRKIRLRYQGGSLSIALPTEERRKEDRDEQWTPFWKMMIHHRIWVLTAIWQKSIFIISGWLRRNSTQITTKTFVTYCQHYKTNINIKEILQCDSLERFKVTLWEMANMNLYQPDQVFPLLDVLYR